MDELTEALATSFQVTYEPNSTSAQHPRFSEYKKQGNKINQDDRRQHYLQLQKERRFDCNALVRNLSLGSWDKHDDREADVESMDYDVVLRKPGRYYKNQLMFSEWLVEVPEDFEEEWAMVICPVGKRTLVVASQGSTSAYGKSGYRANIFQSLLPGGNRNHRSKFGDCTIMDCIFDEVNKTYFVLDLMYWKLHPLYDSETEFRFYWLSTKLSETPELQYISKLNQFKFIALPCFPCKKDVISAALSSVKFPIDGLLFYHKRTHYTFGSTPLVVWLKPYMLPEILDIREPADLLSQAPAGYSNYASHMAVEKNKEPYGPNYGKHGKKKAKGKRKQEGMEIGQSDSTDTSLNTTSSDSPNTSVNVDPGAAGDATDATMEQDNVKPDKTDEGCDNTSTNTDKNNKDSTQNTDSISDKEKEQETTTVSEMEEEPVKS